MLVQNAYETPVVPTSQNTKKDKRFLCNVCCKQFQHKGNLNSHMRSHTGERPYTCDVCDKRFSTSGILKTHMRTHTGEKPYLCDTCGKRFSHIGILKNHMLTHSGERPHRCPVPDCGKDYSRAANLKIHMRSHTGERPFKCEYPKCDWTFVSNADLKVHQRSHTGEKPYICNVMGCKKEFTHSRDFKNHMQMTHGDINKPLEKDISFANSRPNLIKSVGDKSVKYDWITLEGEFKKIENLGTECQKSQRPYACSSCPYTFSTLAKLKFHIKEHEISSDSRPYKCGECGRKFSHPRNIHRHMVLSHGKPETTGPFTLALMSPDRIPFLDKNGQLHRGQKRPLEDLHKSAFTPVAKSPNTSPSNKSPPINLPPTNPTKLYITNVQSLREDSNPFPDIRPLTDDSISPNKCTIKEEKKSPRHHPYAKPPTKIAPRPVPRLAPKPSKSTTQQFKIVQAVNIPTYHAVPVKVEPKSEIPSPVAQRPLLIHTPVSLPNITMVEQIRYAALAAAFNNVVHGVRAYQTYQTMKCFYRCLVNAKQSIEMSKMPW